MLRELIEPTNLARTAIFVVLCLVAAFPAMVAYGALRNLWADYKDSPDAVYLVVGTICIAAAAVPMVFAARIVWNGPPLVIAAAMLVAALAVVGLVMFMDTLGRRNAERHIEERQRDFAVPPPSNPQLTPVATPSIGTPR